MNDMYLMRKGEERKKLIRNKEQVLEPGDTFTLFGEQFPFTVKLETSSSPIEPPPSSPQPSNNSNSENTSNLSPVGQSSNDVPSNNNNPMGWLSKRKKPNT